MAIRRSSHARHELWYHFAWSTKYRKLVWKDAKKREKMKRLFREITKYYGMEIVVMELLTDHIHSTMTASPQIAPSDAVHILKSVSTKAFFSYNPELKRIYWGGELWVQGYFVRTVVPGLTKEQIDNYILHGKPPV